MTLRQFQIHIRYSIDCPDYINEMRWNAMILWWNNNLRFQIERSKE